MKSLFLSFSILFTFNSMAGGFLWPNVEYEYAIVYLFNVPFNESSERPEYSIYQDGVYAKSKIGNGYPLPPDVLDAFHGRMVRGVDELVMGLGKCFIPRHGIIYYNKFGVPVASLSICFECDRIAFWSSEEILKFKDSGREFDKAEKQIGDMKSDLVRAKVPVLMNDKAYETYLDSTESYKNNGEMFFHEDKNDTLFNKFFTKEDAYLWITDPARRFTEFKETNELKITAGGDRYMFNKVSDNNGTVFYFSDDDPATVTDVTIVNPIVRLPNGVQIGMSTDEVIGTFPVYDGVAWPAHINLIKMNYVIDYYFERQTLVRITLRRK